jgi:outer membrane immunogenic protein
LGKAAGSTTRSDARPAPGAREGAANEKGSLSAADLPARPVLKAMPAPLPVFSWTGCYVGPHVGWGWGKNDLTQRFSSDGGIGPFSFFAFSRVGTTTIDTSGAVFGGQAGCDWQFTQNLVIGAQGQLSGTDINGLANDVLSAGFGEIGSYGLRTKWMASITGRLGWAGIWSPQSMIYVKGGVAQAGFQLDTRHMALPAGVPEIINFDLKGWTVGGGLTWAFAHNWAAFVEYNYYDFRNDNFFNNTTTSPFFPFPTTTQSLDMKSRIQTVTVGFNWRFLGN